MNDFGLVVLAIICAVASGLERWVVVVSARPTRYGGRYLSLTSLSTRTKTPSGPHRPREDVRLAPPATAWWTWTRDARRREA